MRSLMRDRKLRKTGEQGPERGPRERERERDAIVRCETNTKEHLSHQPPLQPHFELSSYHLREK